MTGALEPGDAMELAEMLQFLRDLTVYAPHTIGEQVACFTGGGYTLDELRDDLTRFAYLLCDGDSERFVEDSER